MDSDKFLRALGVKRAAAAQWAAASPQTKSVVGAYTAGINAWLRQGLRARPPEFVVLGLQPHDWTPEDMLPKPYFDWDYDLYRTDRGK